MYALELTDQDGNRRRIHERFESELEARRVARTVVHENTRIEDAWVLDTTDGCYTYSVKLS